MQFYDLKLLGLSRRLPILPLGPKRKIASFNLLGDRDLVNRSAGELVKKVGDIDFDFLVGPEVKVVPLLHEMANILGHDRYVVSRKSIMGYMLKPISSKTKPVLVLDGRDALLLKGKKVIIVDDVVSTGRTVKVLSELMNDIGTKVVGIASIFKQGDQLQSELNDLIYLAKLPIDFKNQAG